MNVLNVAKTLKDIKLKQLDDEFQSRITEVINPLFPLNININSDTTGDEILTLLDTDVPRELRVNIMNTVIFSDDAIRRFFNDVDRCQRDMVKNVEFDDSVKSKFLSHTALFLIIAVLLMMGGYAITTSTRGDLPPSKSISVISYIVKALSNDTEIIKHEVGE